MHDEGTVRARFWAKVDKSAGTDGCWIWTASLKPNGYGQFGLSKQRRSAYAHRISYEMAHGLPVPTGLVTDHLCRNRACVNPNHLEAVSQSVNVMRGLGPTAPKVNLKTHCKHGHEFTSENTWMRSNPPGRVCRACRNRDVRNLRARRRVEGGTA